MLKLFRKKDRKEKSDAELLEAYQKSQDLESLGILYERYIELVYGLCLKYYKHESDAEDGVMQIFETLVEKAKTHQVKQFKSWLYVLAKNHCLMQLRKSGKNRVDSTDPALMQFAENGHPDMDIKFQEKDLQTQGLKNCLEQLSTQQKACIEAFYIQGLSYKEIAEEKDLNLGTVRSFIQNGRRNLKLCLEKKKNATSKAST